MSDFVCGANEAGYHLSGVNFGRDLPEPALVADLRKVVAGDPSPDGKGALEIVRGIEVGHIFQLRTRYSTEMKATFLDEQGKSRPFEMGCYGIGVTRIVGAAIEQGNDERGIVWPDPIAPFRLAIVPLGYRRSDAVRQAANALYEALADAGIDVLLDDRDERPGVLLADSELIGIPHRVVIGERGLKDGKLEYQGRREASATGLPVAEAAEFLTAKLCATSS
jgi:prolyl-tRNA synthetase